MKVNNLTLSAIGLVSLAAAQNGNDPLILNNRTGLSPVVYDTFSTSYTKALFSESHRGRFLQALPVTVSIIPPSIYSDPSYSQFTTSVECWRNDYPCDQSSDQHVQRGTANFVRATTTSTIGELSIETDEAIVSILPISIPTPSTEKESIKLPAMSPVPALATEAGSMEGRKAGVPVDWWRGPGQPVDPEGPIDSIQHHPVVHSDVSLDCDMHYCQTWKSSIDPTFSPTAPSTMQTSVTTEPQRSVAPPAVPILVN